MVRETLARQAFANIGRGADRARGYVASTHLRGV
jgi:hypothetical protein